MYSKEDVVEFVRWWNGPEKDMVFEGDENISVEVGLEYWEKHHQVRHVMIVTKELEKWSEQALVDMRCAINLELERRSQEAMKPFDK